MREKSKEKDAGVVKSMSMRRRKYLKRRQVQGQESEATVVATLVCSVGGEGQEGEKEQEQQAAGGGQETTGPGQEARR